MALCASNYYNGCLFHRNIKGFIVQTGDPTHTGKGGTSIWGRKFEDEFKENLKVTMSTFDNYQTFFFLLTVILFYCDCSTEKEEQYQWLIMDLTQIVANFSLPTLHNQIWI